jgi:glutathione S-transferase
MKLYYTPGACSLSPHIALQEAGLAHELVKVDLKAKKLANGEDFTTVNPKSQVPALELDNGELITEGPVIVQVIADKAADKKLAPANGTPERYRLQEWLNFISTELHKAFSPLFNQSIPEEAKKVFRDRLSGKFTYLDGKLAGQDYLMGQQFTVADGYLYTMLRWADRVNLDVAAMKNLAAFKERVGARPKVQAALAAEA